MHYLSYISFSFLLYQFLNILINFLCNQKIRRCKQYEEPLVSLLIPARNEEKNIDLLLRRLVQIKSEQIEIIVYDDQSSDKTSAVVKHYSKQDNRIKRIDSQVLPAGWLGKNHACYQLAQQAKGDFYLFIDADVRLYGSIIQDAVQHSIKYNLGLLSIFPHQILFTMGEKVTVPIMNYILLTLLSLVFVRISPFVSHAAANGQFMLFNAHIYNELQPHKHFKASPVEDISISKYFKKNNIKVACISSEKKVKCRMYKGYEPALNGFAKNVFMFFGNQPILAFLFWIYAALGVLPVIVFDTPYIVPYLAIVCLIQLLVGVVSKQGLFVSVLLFPVQLIFLFNVLVRALFIKSNSSNIWKGREIY